MRRRIARFSDRIDSGRAIVREQRVPVSIASATTFSVTPGVLRSADALLPDMRQFQPDVPAVATATTAATVHEPRR